MSAVTGSSPLTRGKPGPTSYAGNITGLIPAHAGKTRSPTSYACAKAAHPRSRGENQAGSLDSDLVCGSSPLTRGKRAACNDRADRRGLIPAHAGKTPW